MKLLKSISTLLFFFLLINVSFGQEPKAFKEKSDPEAKKILKKLKKNFDTNSGIHVKYKLTMEFGDEKEIQDGEIYQQEDKYYIKNEGNIIICDGKTVWYYTKKQNEVQINDYYPEEDLLSPSKILNIYKADDEYFYAITDKGNYGYKIEFKPFDKDSEIMKVRIVVDPSQTKIESVKVFSDDGSRYTFEISSLKKKTVSASQFKFDASKYPGVNKVDLRE